MFNRKIKEVCRIAGITDMYSLERTKGGYLQIITKKKYTFISSHTARRSFMTNFYLQTKDLQATSKFACHTSIKTTEIYLKNTVDETADRYINHSFF